MFVPLHFVLVERKGFPEAAHYLLEQEGQQSKGWQASIQQECWSWIQNSPWGNLECTSWKACWMTLHFFAPKCFFFTFYCDLFSNKLCLLGHWGNLHWQEVPLHWRRVHSWSYSHWSCPEDEDAKDYRYPPWLSSLHQEVQPFREETPQHVSSPFTLLQVIIPYCYFHLLKFIEN